MSRASTLEFGPRVFAGAAPISSKAASAVVPLVMSAISPRSVVDVGCGLGMWARAFADRGVDVLGVDAHSVPRERLLISQQAFEPIDLSKDFELGRRFDLVVSLEVAEHLPAASAETFVRSLVKLGDVILFSAAIPYQRGPGHVNEQWPEYWARVFHRHGYRTVDYMRKRIWNEPDVPPYYKQNMLFYVTETALERYPELAKDALGRGELPLSLVHPQYYLRRSDFARSSVKWHYHRTIRHYGLAVAKRLGILRAGD